MRFLIALALFVGCTFSAYPVDTIGPGIYCQPLSDFQQRCHDRYGDPWICTVSGMGWHCVREYPSLRGYTQW